MPCAHFTQLLKSNQFSCQAATNFDPHNVLHRFETHEYKAYQRSTRTSACGQLLILVLQKNITPIHSSENACTYPE